MGTGLDGVFGHESVWSGTGEPIGAAGGMRTVLDDELGHEAVCSGTEEPI